MKNEQFSRTAPVPLRLLIAWPDELADTLEWELRDLRRDRQLSITKVSAQNIDTQLQRKGYFHVLLISVLDYENLSSTNRQKFGKRVNLLILIPGNLTLEKAQELLAFSSAGIAFPSMAVEQQMVKFVLHLSTNLVAQSLLYDAVTLAWGQAVPDASPPFIALSRQDGAIWPQSTPPVSGTIPVGRSSASSPSTDAQYPSAGPAVVIYTAVFGDLYQAEHDQVNIVRAEKGKRAITQKADGDQVNITRGMREKSPSCCSHCGAQLDLSSRFCDQCGCAVTPE